MRAETDQTRDETPSHRRTPHSSFGVRSYTVKLKRQNSHSCTRNYARRPSNVRRPLRIKTQDRTSSALSIDPAPSVRPK